MEYYHHFSNLIAQKSYSKQNALSLALACELAYDNKQAVKSVVQSWGLKLVDVISKKKGMSIDTQCFIMSDDENVVVVFRGSESVNDWLGNIQATQDPGPLVGGQVHEGFQDALFPAVIALGRHIHDAEANKKRIWVTGHSLGGALASIYAGMLLENDFEVYGLYTFASPRPGNAKFAQELNKYIQGPHFRVVNDGDIAPHFFPEPFFSHPGNRTILKANKKEHTKESWFKQRIAALKYFVKVTGDKLDIFDNHSLMADNESYVPRLIRDLERK